MSLAEELKSYPSAAIERIIARWQSVQKERGPDSHDGRYASAQLQPLFEEMARRQKAGLL